MNLALAVVTAVAVANPFRIGAALPQRDRWPVAISGGLAAGAVLILVAAASRPLLDGLEVTAATAAIGAGAAVIVVGIRAVLARPPGPEPSLPGRRAALVPVAFPVLLDPGVALLVVAVSADRGTGPAVLVAVAALVVGLAVGALVGDGASPEPSATRPSWNRIGHGAVGTLAVATGVAVTIDGVLRL